jgi:hypothetical protein
MPAEASPVTTLAISIGWPMHLLSHSASSSDFSSMRSASLFMALVRWAGVHLDHSPLKAARAAETAASMSAMPATWMIFDTRDSSWGLRTVINALEVASTY